MLGRSGIVLDMRITGRSFLVTMAPQTITMVFGPWPPGWALESVDMYFASAPTSATLQVFIDSDGIASMTSPNPPQGQMNLGASQWFQLPFWHIFDERTPYVTCTLRVSAGTVTGSCFVRVRPTARIERK